MVTIKDIARESGYSVSTVSRVLNHRNDVSPDATANATVGVPGQTGMATVVNHGRWCIVQFHIGIIHLFYDTFYLGR